MPRKSTGTGHKMMTLMKKRVTCPMTWFCRSQPVYTTSRESPLSTAWPSPRLRSWTTTVSKEAALFAFAKHTWWTQKPKITITLPHCTFCTVNNILFPQTIDSSEEKPAILRRRRIWKYPLPGRADMSSVACTVQNSKITIYKNSITHLSI